ncbi:MAG: DUF975 family protein [Clostridia bacterium]|nr:DUF975 family protein [Clostridia bacterium]
MDYSRTEIKLRAKDKLKGNFGTAVVVCLIYMLIISAISGIFSIPSMYKTVMRSMNNDQTQTTGYAFDGTGLENADGTESLDEIFDAYNINNNTGASQSDPMIEFTESFSPLSTVGTIITLLVSGPLAFGMAAFFVRLTRKREADLGELFSGFKKCLGESVLLALLIGIFTFLWSLLFIIPGIIAGLRYGMAYFILVDNPGMSAKDALDQSKAMMKGNCGKLFVLNLSFIGWGLLCVLTLGIGFIFLQPYMEASVTEFYNEISGKNNEPAFAEGDYMVHAEPFAAPEAD